MMISDICGTPLLHHCNVDLMNTKTDSRTEWQQTDAQVFWGEIAPYDHVVQIYENDQTFIDLLAGFVGGGIRNGESVVVIATAAHLQALHENLKAQGFDPFYLSVKDQYIPLDAADTLSKFMVDGWPDENLFNHVVSETITKAKRYNRPVRAFGEMVALLWAKGQSGATVQLENLWNKFCATDAFSLLCAYPKSGFTDDPKTSLLQICNCHSKMVAGVDNKSNQLFYKSVDRIAG